MRAAETSWAGNNSADMLGTYGKCESGEAYLADMVVASAAVIHGVLGITHLGSPRSDAPPAG